MECTKMVIEWDAKMGKINIEANLKNSVNPWSIKETTHPNKLLREICKTEDSLATLELTGNIQQPARYANFSRTGRNNAGHRVEPSSAIDTLIHGRSLRKQS